MVKNKSFISLVLVALLIMISMLIGCSTKQEENTAPDSGNDKIQEEEKQVESAIKVEIVDDAVIFSNEVISGKYLLTFETTRDNLTLEGKRSFGGITDLKFNGTDILDKDGIIQPWNIYTWRPEFKDAWLYLEVPTAEIVTQTEEEAVVRLAYNVKQTEGAGEYQAIFDMNITKSSPVIGFDVTLNRLNAVDPNLEEYHADFGEVPGFIELVVQTDLGYGPEQNVYINSHKKIEEGKYEDQGVQNISSLEANFDHWHWNQVYGWPNFRTAENWILFATPTEDKGVGLVHDGSLKWMTHYGPDHGALVTLAARSLDELGKQTSWNKANQPSEKIHFSIFPYVSDSNTAIEEARKVAK
jgi:hypothetical protein